MTRTFRWPFACALVLLAAAGDAAAQSGALTRISYGYGAPAPVRGESALDVRRVAPPAEAALAEAPDLPGTEEEGEAEETAAPAPLAPDQSRALSAGFTQTGTASWYGADFAGRATASGEAFNPALRTAAHRDFPLPSLVEVTNVENGQRVVLRVNDRGPAVADRLIDVSASAADELGFRAAGQARVQVRYLGPAPRHIMAEAPPPAAPAGPASLLPPGVEAAALTPAPAPPPAPPRAAPPLTGGFVVQVGAFSDLTNAHRVQAALQDAGPVLIEPRMVGQTEIYRVRLGPWANRAEAEAMLGQMAERGYPNAIVAAR